ncbi:MAG: hypothetical protein EBU66_13895 [Bacteroidetes bacterium]|nr:hypothetical protein [bacterium]NBP65740.1 hypothetical protein [Bacteroidota bacterium]
MARKTNRKQKKQQKRTKKVKRAAPAPAIESHSFKSSMTFDGNTLTTKTQKDNEPVVERRFTRRDLAQQIPIGKELVDDYLDGEMPRELQYHKKNKPKMFTNVLISPGDLGLLPPPRMIKTKRRKDHAHAYPHAHAHGEIQLLVDDRDDDDRDAYRISRRVKRPRNLFDLP